MAAHPLLNWIQINWHSRFASHKMTLPTRPYTPGATPLDDGAYVCWDSISRLSASVVTDFVDLYKALIPPSAVLDRYTVFTRSSPTASPVPQFTRALAVVGTSVATGWDEATQYTYSMRTTGFNPSKLVILDSPSDNLFGKYYTLTAPYSFVIDKWMSADAPWAGRDGLQPIVFVSVTVDINDRLRREYHIK